MASYLGKWSSTKQILYLIDLSGSPDRPVHRPGLLELAMAYSDAIDHNICASFDLRVAHIFVVVVFVCLQIAPVRELATCQLIIFS